MLDFFARLRDRQLGDHIFAARFAGLPERCSCTVDDFLGNSDELTVCPGLNDPGAAAGSSVGSLASAAAPIAFDLETP